MRHLIPALIAAAAVTAAPAAMAREKLEPEAQLAKLLEGRVAGEPRDCIPLSTARSTALLRPANEKSKSPLCSKGRGSL